MRAAAFYKKRLNGQTVSLKMPGKDFDRMNRILSINSILYIRKILFWEGALTG